MERLFLGIGNHAVCVKKSDGEIIWKTKLKSSNITNVHFEDNKVFAYAGGHLFCLNAQDGEKIWENSLKGLGYGACIIASERENSAVISNQMNTQATAILAASASGAAVATTSS
ncbi:PQQ-binding-like beta-propeller repeat protein [Parashewanella tropica]|uniref:outer membrane protein assembly factor BamB family protein n=1 Tax=Parashewanella tropica TaxID=2547970 RepID=UPI00105A5FF3|nr:PQQ-binding-like beta-propeller repeat protein [Parashewanella tropica]